MAFVAEAALIALREGLEALLITGILLGLVVKLGRPDARKHVWIGFGAAVLASVVAGWLVQTFLLAQFEEQGGAEVFELVAVVVAVVVLTYMVFWMWKHTRGLMATLRGQVEDALTRGALLSIVLLTFASVVREGIEVVLFYGALSSRAAPIDLAWSGLVGLVASAGLVWLILRGASRLDLSGFFAITGVMLVFVAGGLLVHGVSAAMGLGLLPPAPALWDTSAVLSDDSALGRVLHAMVGYASTPTLLQGLLYFGYVLGVGGAYLWSLGAFHRRAPEGRSVRSGRAASAALAVVLVVSALGYGAANPGALVEGHDHGEDEHGEPLALASIPGGERIGILLRSHGEPVHYNETTYRSFADFIQSLLVMADQEELLMVDQGTVLLDRSRPFEKCDPTHVDADLMDAWLQPARPPAACGSSPLALVAGEAAATPLLEGFYVQPGGPGLGEPDILEIVGLSAYVEWLQMDNASPMHATKGLLLDAAERILRERYGDRVVIARSYHVVPHVGPGETDAEAAETFAAAGVTTIIDAYTTTVFSDVMNTCMMRPHLEHELDLAGYSGRLVHAGMAGHTHEYAHAVAARVKELLAEVPEGEEVAVFLTHHGQDPGYVAPCTQKADPYNANAKLLYEGVRAALDEEIAREGVTYHQVYGQGAEEATDGVLSPTEALAVAKRAGVRHVIDLPFELTGNGFDNLVVQRSSYGLPREEAPHYDANGETRLEVDGMRVRIASAVFSTEARGLALAAVIDAALVEAFGGAHDADGHAH